MHELALTQEILETVRPHVGKGLRLEKVVVECGVCSGVAPDSLDLCFAAVAEHMGFKGARLEIRMLEATGICSACAAEASVDTLWASCPKCGHTPLTVRSGDGLRVKEIRVKEV